MVGVSAWKKWSGRRDSNPRPSAWEANALPTEPLPRFSIAKLVLFLAISEENRKKNVCHIAVLSPAMGGDHGR